MGAGILIVPLAVYLFFMTVLCFMAGTKTSWKVGWLLAAASVFLPLGVVIAAIIP